MSDVIEVIKVSEASHASHCQLLPPQAGQPTDLSVALAALRQAGADQFDPVGLHYLGVLARRANGQQGRVRVLLDDKLAQTLAAFKARFEHAQAAARADALAAIDPNTPHGPQSADELQPLRKKGDTQQGLAPRNTKAQPASLGELTRDLTQRVSGQATGQALGPLGAPQAQRFAGPGGQHPEPNATQYFRNTWSKISVAKRVAQALDQAPKNAGPLNSQRLVLRSLALMREMSPDYLNRFTSYVDALLCLDQCDKEKQAQVKKTAEGDSSKKPKTRRAQAR